MKNTRKISIVLVLVMVLMMTLAVIPSSAANIEGGTKLYLVPSANWNQSNARFAAYFFGNGEAWVSMTKVAGESNLYEVTAPTGSWTNVIFCRMNPSASANNWNNKWNQTSDLVYNGSSNCYTVKEGTWDKGGGTWSSYGNSCAHSNVSAAATCTTDQVCLDCGDPVVSALGHTYNASHLCTRCNGQAAFTVAGSGAHLGTEWDTGNTANDMTYADGVYTKVYTNVAAGSYLLKVVRDHDWGTAYPDADKSYTVATAGSTVTVTLKGTAVTITVDAPHTHSWSNATCTEPQKCACGETQGEALGHAYFYPCDAHCMVCYELTNESAAHRIAHVDAVAATCKENGNVEYWYCEDCGACWLDENLTLIANRMSIVTTGNHAYFYPCDAHCMVCGELTNETPSHRIAHVDAVKATCTANGNLECWYCEDCGTYWLDEALTQQTNRMSVVVPANDEHTFVEGKCECGAEDPNYVPNPYLINFSTWPEFAKETYADGDILKHNDIFTFIMGKNSRVDASSKEWDDLIATLRFSLGGKTNSGVPTKNAIMITVDGTYTLKIWYVAGGDGRYFELRDANGAAISTTTSETVKNGQYYGELLLPAAGVYYLTIPADNNYIFQLELVKSDAPVHEHSWADATCEAPKTCTGCGETEGEALGHLYYYNLCLNCYAPNPYFIANSLVVGENKVICNEYHLVGDGQNGNHTFPYEFVLLTVTEDGTYNLTGDMLGFTIFTIEINTEGADFSNTGASWLTFVIGGTAELKAGTYYVGLVYTAGQGEYTVNVAKAHEHSFVDGKCECGESDPNYVPPHEHEFVEGKCECGETDPDYVAPDTGDNGNEGDSGETPVAPELGFFQKLWLAILAFIKKLLGLA